MPAHPVRLRPSGTSLPTGLCKQSAKAVLLIHRYRGPPSPLGKAIGADLFVAGGETKNAPHRL